MTLTEIVTAITSGEADQNITAVFDALKARQRYLRQQQSLANVAELTTGTKVRITNGISPQYLIGVTGMVSFNDLHPKPGFILMDVDDGQDTGRWSGKQIRVPASCLARA